MSTQTLEKTAVDTGSDLASLVVAYHRRAHPAHHIHECAESMCRVAGECIDLDAMFYGTSD